MVSSWHRELKSSLSSGPLKGWGSAHQNLLDENQADLAFESTANFCSEIDCSIRASGCVLPYGACAPIG